MANLAFEVIQGPNTGQKIPIKMGYRVGSGHGDAQVEVKLPARNILGLHGKIVPDEKNQMNLIAVSSNRLFTINSQKVHRVPLFLGQTFKIEELLIRVVALDFDSPKVPPKLQSPIATPFDLIEQKLLSCISAMPIKNTKIGIRPFKNPLQMRFTQGIQFDETFTIGWGPRNFGKNTYEFSLLDPETPDLAFTLTPGPIGEFLYSTTFPNVIFINGHRSKKAILNSGDKIKFGDTIIEILELEYF